MDINNFLATMDRWFFSGWGFVLGACLGSFFKLCRGRWQKGQSVFQPGSHCDFCGQMLPWYYKIPLASYLGLKGRCGFCGQQLEPGLFWTEFCCALGLGTWIWMAWK